MEKKNINIFNLNFFCKNEKSIIDIYTKKTDVIVFNNKHAFKAEKYIFLIELQNFSLVGFPFVFISKH